MGVVERVGPRAAAQRVVTVAVVAQGGRLVGEADRVVAGVHIRDGQRSVGRQRAVFGDRTRARAADHRSVLGAVDRDRHDLRAAVGGGEGVRVGQRFTGIEGLHGGMGVIERVGPRAATERVVAVAVVAQGGRRVREADRVVARVHVRDGQRAVSRKRAVFGDRARARAADHRGVFGAIDRDRHVMGRAVRRFDCQDVSEAFPHIQLLDGRLTVIGTVRPGSGGIDCEVTIRSCDRFGLKTGFAAIGVANGKRTTGFQETIDIRVDILGHRPCICASDHRRIGHRVDRDGGNDRAAAQSGVAVGGGGLNGKAASAVEIGRGRELQAGVAFGKGDERSVGDLRYAVVLV